MEEKIILYHTGCPKCVILKEKLDSLAIPYEEGDIVDWYNEGNMFAPGLKVNGESLDFARAIEVLNLMKR